jgi:hypothetical protein
MARPLRLEFEGALHQVTARGDRREPIFEYDVDRQTLLCHRPAQWSHLVIGTLRPRRDRHNEASRGSAHRSQRRIGVMEPVMH